MDKIKCLKFSQNGINMFIFFSTVKHIYEKFDVSRRIEDKEKGYQRSFSASRIKEISRYISRQKGILPNSILVNIDIESAAYDSKTKEICFKKSLKTYGWIIDGQHRVKGAYEGDPDFVLPVVATYGLDLKEQAKLFIKINKTQRGVATSLYLDLLDITDGIIEDYDDDAVPGNRKAVEIAKRLNAEEDSPLYDLIRMTGDKGRGISLSEFVSQSQTYLTPGKGELAEFGFEQQYMIFKMYFKAIKAVFYEQWIDEKSLILKTVGFGGLMNAFSCIFNTVIRLERKFDTSSCTKVLKKIEGFKFDTATLPGGGVKAQMLAGEKLREKLKKQIKTDNNSDSKVIGNV